MSARLPPDPDPATPPPGSPGTGGQPPPPPPPSAPPPPAERLLRRSHSERVLAGVCGGLGRYLGIDPVLLRIAFVVLGLANGLGVIAYVVAWIVIPEERPGQPIGPAPAARREAGRLVLGGALVVLGLVLLLDRLAPDIDQLFWPVAVVAVGVAIILIGLRR
jgi:phage shock protein C